MKVLIKKRFNNLRETIMFLYFNLDKLITLIRYSVFNKKTFMKIFVENMGQAIGEAYFLKTVLLHQITLALD